MSEASEAYVSSGEHVSKGPFGDALFQATLKRSPADFRVHELLDIVPDGVGEHLWLHVEKRGLDTWAVRDALAQAVGCPERDIGHAGLKDRHAVTRQWFSVRVVRASDASDTPDVSEQRDAVAVDALVKRLGSDALRVLHTARHARKLRIGAHRGNAFEIVLHEVRAPDGAAVDPAALATALQQRAERVRTLGCPNRFGEQRFGRDGDNVTQARALLCGGSARKPRRLTRRKRGLLLSAARAHLFNRVLDARVQRDDWHRLLPGEPVMLNGSRSLFVPEVDDATIDDRLAALDVSPTGPLPGRGTSLARHACAQLEAQLLHDESALIEGIVAAGVEAGRRALRVAVPDLAVALETGTGGDPSSVRLRFRFALPSGSFATSLIALFGATRPAARTA